MGQDCHGAAFITLLKHWQSTHIRGKHAAGDAESTSSQRYFNALSLQSRLIKQARPWPDINKVQKTGP